jgi:hypothetical protein
MLKEQTTWPLIGVLAEAVPSYQNFVVEQSKV